MTFEAATVVKVLSEAARPLSRTEIQRRLGVLPENRNDVKRLLRAALLSGQIAREGKRYKLGGVAPEKVLKTEKVSRVVKAEKVLKTEKVSRVVKAEKVSEKPGNFVIGKLMRHRDGFGFVRPEGLKGPKSRDSDVYLSAEELEGTLTGDRIKIEVVRGRGGRTAGKMVELLQRRRTQAIGRYRLEGKRAFIEPLTAALGDALEVRPSPLALPGQFVRIALPGQGTIGKVLSLCLEGVGPREEALEVAFAQGFSDVFPPEVVAQAETCSFDLDPEEVARRRDLRDLPLVTIDGADARDFDDAVYVEKTKRGFRLVVAIADVSYYVTKGSALDREALHRATSVYFPNMVLPMLPERLSNGICSLEPNADRFCMVADMLFEPIGKGAEGVACVGTSVYEAVMRSHARCVYEEVSAVLEGEPLPKLKSVRSQLLGMETLARALMATREARGSLDLDLPEFRAVLDENQRPVQIAQRGRTFAHRLIEEFMLAANEAVARSFSERGLPTVYRIHAEPDPEKLEKFLAMAQIQGYELPPGTPVTGLALNALLKEMVNDPKRKALNALMLRSLMQAVYSGANIGHFGLAAAHYLHFTSPIRRYPDLMVHRLLREQWRRGGRALSPSERERKEAEVMEIGELSSERERAAMEASREVDAYFAALYMSQKLGESFDGAITAVTEFGFFVLLKDENVEGLVKAETLGADGVFDSEGQRFALGNGQSYGLGDEVRVQVTRADPSRRQIDFEVVSAGSDRDRKRRIPPKEPKALKSKPKQKQKAPGKPRTPRGRSRT